jgi:hypothetical protein
MLTNILTRACLLQIHHYATQVGLGFADIKQAAAWGLKSLSQKSEVEEDGGFIY